MEVMRPAVVIQPSETENVRVTLQLMSLGLNHNYSGWHTLFRPSDTTFNKNLFVEDHVILCLGMDGEPNTILSLLYSVSIAFMNKPRVGQIRGMLERFKVLTAVKMSFIHLTGRLKKPA